MKPGKYQVTIFCSNGKYKPIGTIIETKEEMEKKVIVSKGLEKICIKKRWTNAERKKWGYDIAKIRDAP